MTEELRKLLKAAKTDEEKKSILETHKDALSEEDLQNIAGGKVYIYDQWYCEYEEVDKRV